MARILVIHPDDKLRRLLGRVLTQDGHAVDAATCGFGGLGLLRRRPPDLVLLDLPMPDIEESEFLERLRDEGHHELPIIVLSAVAAVGMPGGNGREAHSETVPFDADRLLAAVRWHLRTLSRG